MRRLLMVSNRLPLTFRNCDQHGGQTNMSAGGLATALRAVARQRPVRWIGWAGADYDPNIRDIIASSVALDCDLVPLFLSEADRREFYCGFCNEIIWPLFHDLSPTSSFEPAYWRRYLDVNARYTASICREASPDDLVWVHDYHLMLQGKLLSTHFTRDQLAFFLHIPFPPPDVFAKLPWKLEILDSLLSFGTVGLQTAQDCRNFVACARTYFPQAQLRPTTSGTLILRGQNRTVVRHCPIGVDFDEFAHLAMQPHIVAEAGRIRRAANVRRLVLGVDRLDYTKGIPERLEAFRDVLSRYPGLRQEIGLIQVVVPSREEIPRYKRLKNQVEDLVRAINRQFGTPSWVPIRYQYGHLSREQLVAHYRAADIALVTPLKDGMNLVAKEFCASRVDQSGILILSEFAGAAVQLRTGAYLVDPRHTPSIASALHDAIDPDEGDVRRRMRRMRRNVKVNDIHRWCDEMLSGTSALEREASARQRGAPVGMPDSWPVHMPQMTTAVTGETQ
jgi:alpha,alpha-trehalose-phosphate synthase [UDP-forming]